MENLIKQVLKFGLVGGTAFLIDYSILYLFTDVFKMYYLISSIVSFSVSTIFNYIASTIWVFDVDKNASKIKNLIVFIILSVIGLSINQLIMMLGVEMFNIHYMIVKLFATILVMIFNFITRKLFLEK